MINVYEYVIRVYKIKTMKGKGYLNKKLEEFMNNHDFDEELMMLMFNEYEEDILTALKGKAFKENNKIGYIFAVLNNHMEEFLGYLKIEEQQEKQRLFEEIKILMVKGLELKDAYMWINKEGRIGAIMEIHKDENEYKIYLDLWDKKILIGEDDEVINKITQYSSIKELQYVLDLMEEKINLLAN